jgi:hypothetical protein
MLRCRVKKVGGYNAMPCYGGLPCWGQALAHMSHITMDTTWRWVWQCISAIAARCNNHCHRHLAHPGGKLGADGGVGVAHAGSPADSVRGEHIT